MYVSSSPALTESRFERAYSSPISQSAHQAVDHRGGDRILQDSGGESRNS